MRKFVTAILILSYIFQPITNLYRIPVLNSVDPAENATVENGLEAENADPVPLYSETVKGQDLEVAKKPITFSLKANPQLIVPGADISIEWTVNGWEEALKNEDLEIAIDYPKYLQVKETEAAVEEQETGMRMTYSPNLAQGGVVFSMDSSIKEETYLISVALNSREDTLTSDSIRLTMPSLEAIAGRDNSLVSADGRVELDFPAKSLSESLYLDVRFPSPSSLSGYSLSGQPLEVVAVGQTSNENVEKFKNNFTISMKYDPELLFGGAEEDLKIYYYDESINNWWPVQTTVDKETQTLSAQVDHLTVFDYKASSWQQASVPTLDQAQVNGSTGAATYNMSFWMPPAQGGFGPSLSLSYNSQIIDSSSAFTQASWVGAGWSLDTGYIERNMHATNDDLTDDTFQLVLNGVASRLLPIDISGSVTTYAAEEINYWQIQFDSSENSWTIRDRNGIVYVFDFITKTSPTEGCAELNELTLTWRWSLSTATDPFGNVITYAYTNDIKEGCYNQIAAYPSTITYPNGYYRIVFETEARQDYQDTWTDEDETVFYQTKRLDYIQIEQNVPGTGWTSIRHYEFLYAREPIDPNTYIDVDPVYPEFRWNGNGDWTSTLVAVQEMNGNETVALPATSFTYADQMHITEIDYGQGGTVSFSYERWTFLDDDNDDLWSIYTVFGKYQDECRCIGDSCPSDTLWSVYAGVGTVECRDERLEIYGPVNVGGAGKRYMPQYMIKPGAHYRLYIEVSSIDDTTGILWGFTDQDNPDVQEVGTVGSAFENLEAGKDMPVYYDPSTTVFLIECDDCKIRKLQFMMMPLYYRVTEKTVSDSTTALNGTYSYAYNDGATNDAIHSELQNRPGTKYDLVNREFRGFSQVQVTNPDGLVITTWFYQNDEFTGQAYRTLTSTNIFSDEFSTLNTSDWVFSHTGDPVTERQTIGGNTFQEDWLKSTTTTSDWSTTTTRSDDTLMDGSVAYAQFAFSGNETDLLLGVENSLGDFFGLYADSTSGSATLNMLVQSSGVPSDEVLMSSGVFSQDKWYVVMFFIDDDDGFQVRVWEKNNPENYAEDSSNPPTTGVTWQFTEKVNTGTVLLDSYLEGVPYAETEMKYASTVLYNTLSDSVPDLSGLTDYVDLQVVWTRPTETISRLFDGDYSWSGTRTTYDYNVSDQGGTQFGNLTRTVQSDWGGSQWVDYRGTLTQYYPNQTGNLIAFPAREVTLDCSTGCDFTTANGKLTETLYLYDWHLSVSDLPTMGILTEVRTWVDGNDYAHVSYGYDSYGNNDGQTVYTEYGTAITAPTSGAQTTSHTYDPDCHTYPISSNNALFQTTQMTYDYSLGVATSITDANNQTTWAVYDDFGRTRKVIAPGDSVESPTLSITYYDSSIPFRVALNQKVDEEGRTILLRHYYDGLGNLIQTQTVGAEVEGGIVNTVLDYQYNSMGRIQKETVPYTSTYNAWPVFIYQTFSQANTSYDYDIFGRQEYVTAPNGNITTFAYDGLITHVTDPLSRTTTMTNDTFGRIISVDAPSGPDMTYAYNPLDQLEIATKGADANATSVYLAYDHAGRKVEMSDPDMGVWIYTYDAQGNLISQVDANLQQINLCYDGLNRLTGKFYGSVGDCNTPAGWDVSYYYDGYSAGIFSSYTGPTDYAVGQRTGMLDSSGHTIWTYDPRGNLTQEEKTVGVESFTTQWSYNSSDLLERMVYPGVDSTVEEIYYAYNPQGLVSAVSDSPIPYIPVEIEPQETILFPLFFGGAGGLRSSSTQDSISDFELAYPAPPAEDEEVPLMLSITYDEVGRVVSQTYDETGIGLQTNYDYYDWTEQVNTVPQGGLLESAQTGSLTDPESKVSLAYIYDTVGNVASIIDLIQSPNQTQTFTYDSLDRLATANGSTGFGGAYSESYTYDSFGRMDGIAGVTLTYAATRTGTCQVNNLTPSSSSSIAHAVSSKSGGNSYTYDCNGNTIACGNQTLIYDEENRLVEVRVSGGTVAEYIYDGDGNQVRTIVYDGDLAIDTVYIGTYYQQTTTTDASVSPATVTTDSQKYYFAGSSRLAMRENSDDPLYLITDHLSSTSLVVDATGVEVARRTYMPFGGPWGSSATDLPTDYTYTGQREADEIGLSYYVARWYDPEIAHFTQPDTIVPEAGSSLAWDRYAYTYYNPLKYIDPSGHCTLCIVLAGAAIGAVISYGVQVYNNYQNGYEGTEAWTQNINAEPIVYGGLLGAGAVLLAPVGAAATGDLLVGIGVAAGSTSLVVAGNTAYGVSQTLTNFIYPVSSPDYPVLEWDSVKYPNIAENIRDAQKNGAPSLLSRTQDDAIIKANRASATCGLPGCGPGFSVDEYPFASTYQGGKGAFVKEVPIEEQCAQGGILWQFYRSNNIMDGDYFYVKVK